MLLRFSLSLTLGILIMMCLGVGLFASILFGILCASWTCMSISFTKLGKISFNIFSNRFPISCCFYSPLTPLWCRCWNAGSCPRGCLHYSHFDEDWYFLLFIFFFDDEIEIDLLLHLFRYSLVVSRMGPDQDQTRNLGVSGWHSHHLSYPARVNVSHIFDKHHFHFKILLNLQFKIFLNFSFFFDNVFFFFFSRCCFNSKYLEIC